MAAARGRRIPLVLLGIVLLALVLRGPVVAVSPVAGQVRASLGVGVVGFGLLTSLPVLCFGLAAPLAVLVICRMGPEGAVLLSIGVVATGTVVRASGGYALALVGTVLLGLGITVGNVVVTAVIRRDVPASGRGGATGLFTAALNAGTVLTAAGTAPLAAISGWRVATAASTVLVVVVAAVWVGLLRRSRPAADAVPAPGAGAKAARGPRLLVALLAVTFAAQGFSYYGLTAWLPTLLAEERHLGAEAAGLAAAIFQLAAIVGAFGVPALLPRTPTRRILLVLGLLWCALPLGLLLAPQLYAMWSVLGGAAQGGGFAAIFAIVVRVAPEERAAAGMSATIQTVGYLVAAVAPPLLGQARAATGGWAAPVALVLCATVVFAVVGRLAAARADRPLPARPGPQHGPGAG